MWKKAFSLIELMVVIAIVAILAAVALPVYKHYMIRSKILTGISIAQTYQAKFINLYNRTGSMRPATLPTDPDYNIAISQACIDQLLYSWGTTFKNTQYVFLTYNPTCLGLPSSETSNINLIIVWVNNNNTISTYCGQWNTPGTYLNLKYLPSSCQGISLNTLESTFN